MKHLLPKTALALLSLLGIARTEALASHAQGGDLRYEYIGHQFSPVRPNYYKVTCRLFRDCSGINAPSSLTVNCRVGTPATSCASTDSRNFTATLQLQGQPIYGTQYCSTTTGLCTATGPDNNEENTYTANVTLPAANWTLSVEENARPSLANLSNASGTSLRFEATLDNTSGLNNTSPNFGTMPAVFVPWQQAVALNAGAYDADGDSLSFSLVTPVTGCGQPSTYSAVPPLGTYDMGNGCVTIMAPNTPLSATYPLPSAQLSGSCPARTGTPYFHFDPASGTMLFTPIAYTPNSTTAPSSQGLNKYALSVKVDEFRRNASGNYQHIGSTRREIFLNVYDCGTNQLPRIGATMQAYGMGQVSLSTPIPVRAGSGTSVLLTATDGNAGQRMFFTTNSLNVPGVFSQQTNANTLLVEFNPPATLPVGTYYVTVKVEDDNCPVKGMEVRTIAFRVTNTTLGTRDQAKQLVSTAYPNPFTDEVRFTLARPASAAAAVEVVDQLGRVVERLPVAAGTGSEVTLTWRPTAALPAGVYLARFPQGQQTVRLLHMTR